MTLESLAQQSRTWNLCCLVRIFVKFRELNYMKDFGTHFGGTSKKYFHSIQYYFFSPEKRPVSIFQSICLSVENGSSLSLSLSMLPNIFYPFEASNKIRSFIFAVSVFVFSAWLHLQPKWRDRVTWQTATNDYFVACLSLKLTHAFYHVRNYLLYSLSYDYHVFIQTINFLK